MRNAPGRSLVAAALAALLAVSSGWAEDAKRTRPARSAQKKRQNRQRWEKLDKAKRQEIQKLVQQLRRLPAAQREKLLDKLGSLEPEKRQRLIRQARQRLKKPPEERHAERLQRQMRQRVWNDLTPAERERIKKLSPKEGRAYLQKRYRSARDKLIRTLPAPLQKTVRGLPPAEQTRFLRRHWTVDAAQRTFRDPKELEALRAMPRRKVARALLGQPKKGPPREKPAFLSEATWRRWQKLAPYERPRVLRHLYGPSSTEARKDAKPAARKRATPPRRRSPGSVPTPKSPRRP